VRYKADAVLFDFCSGAVGEGVVGVFGGYFLVELVGVVLAVHVVVNAGLFEFDFGEIGQEGLGENGRVEFADSAFEPAALAEDAGSFQTETAIAAGHGGNFVPGAEGDNGIEQAIFLPGASGTFGEGVTLDGGDALVVAVAAAAEERRVVFAGVVDLAGLEGDIELERNPDE